jgi:hypothetical protein
MDIFSDRQISRTPMPSPIEVWLSRAGAGITCTVVLEDESTGTLDVRSRSMRGAQRELTGYLIAQGYAPVGEWEVEADGDGAAEAVETSRMFKLSVFEFERVPAEARQE